MCWLLRLSLLAPLIAGYVYDITVLRSEELEDVADKIYGIGTSIDVYVLVYGYGNGGEDKVLTQRTSTINNDATPEWNEQFRFDDETDGNGAYEKFLFKLYDDDSITGYDINAPDYLGETDFVLTSDITNCDEIFSQQLPLTDTAGYLFVEIMKYGCKDKAATEYGEEVVDEQENGDCLVGDVMYQNGQSIGVQGDTCLDDLRYSGTESFCIDGEVKEVEYFGDCSKDNEGSKCVQQGEEGVRFAAVCLTDEANGDCLVGDIMYQNGQRVGVLGDTCLDDFKYSGTESICIDGQVEEVDYTGDCSEEYEGSKCVQQDDVAVCVKDEDDEKNPCRVDDMMFPHGATMGHIGYTCGSDGNSYEGTQDVCDDGNILELQYVGDCDAEYEGSSCCQQGAPGTIGGAVCIKGDCEEYDADGENPGYATTKTKGKKKRRLLNM